jgi:hypothetical protein
MSSFQPAVGGDFKLPGPGARLRRASGARAVGAPVALWEAPPVDQLAPGGDAEASGRTEVGLRRPRATPSAQPPQPGDRVLR